MCSDVEVIFARGSGEIPGLGIVGRPFFRAIRAHLRGMKVSAYAVDYAASWNQSSAAAGATNLVEYLVEVANRCPHTRFVLGGYSQGASVVNIALGTRAAPLLAGGTPYKTIPRELVSRIKAVVLFGNPARRYGGRVGGPWANRTREFCNEGDPVCTTGRNYFAHLTYGYNGSAHEAGKFSASLVRA